MARLQNAGRVSATNVEFDRSGTFADARECLVRIAKSRFRSVSSLTSQHLRSASLNIPPWIPDAPLRLHESGHASSGALAQRIGKLLQMRDAVEDHGFKAGVR